MKISVIPDTSAIPTDVQACLRNQVPGIAERRTIDAYCFSTVGMRFKLRGQDIGEVIETRPFADFDEPRGTWIPRMLLQVDWDKEDLVRELAGASTQARAAQRDVMSAIDALRRKAMKKVENVEEALRRDPNAKDAFGFSLSASGVALVDVEITPALSVEVLAGDQAEAEALAVSLRAMIAEDDAPEPTAAA